MSKNVKVLGVKTTKVWLAIRSVEKKNLVSPYLFPIVVLSDTTTATHHSGLILLNNYLKTLESCPEYSISDLEIKAIKNQYAHDGLINCQYCEQDIPEGEITLDHYIPFYLGGKTSYGNLRLSCGRCNRMKGSIHPFEMPQTWKLFQRNLLEKKSVKALNLIEEVLTLPNLDPIEFKLAQKLHQKELEWRESLAQDRLEKASLAA